MTSRLSINVSVQWLLFVYAASIFLISPRHHPTDKRGLWLIKLCFWECEKYDRALVLTFKFLAFEPQNITRVQESTGDLVVKFENDRMPYISHSYFLPFSIENKATTWAVHMNNMIYLNFVFFHWVKTTFAA